MSLTAATRRSARPSADGSCRPDGVEIRFWRCGDTPRINALYNDPAARPDAGGRHAFARSTSQWEWEFASRRPHDPPYAVAVHGGGIIGIQGYIPIELLYDGRTLLSGKDEDTLVHPAFRGRGVLDDLYGLLLGRARAEEVALLWGFTSTAVRPLLRNGYRCVGSFDALRAEVANLRESRSKPGLEGVRIEPLLEPDKRCGRFSLAFARQVGGMTLHLSPEFLRWRVMENPFRRHMMFAALREERIVGIGIFKVEDPEGMGCVSDLAALDDRGCSSASIQNALLDAGVRTFKREGLRAIEARPSGPHPYNQQLRRLLLGRGFVEVHPRHAPQFMVLPVVGEHSAALDMASWRICELMREY